LRRPICAVVAVVVLLAVSPSHASAEEGPDLPSEAFEPPSGGASRAEVTPIVFPVEGPVLFDDGFGRCRDGCSRRHAGFDLHADRLQRLLATTSGTIVAVVDEPVNNAGNYLILEGDDGIEYWYLHVNNDTPGTDDGLNPPEWRFAPGLEVGSRVIAGEFVGYLGDSGNAETTAPHLHFEMRIPPGPPDGLADLDAPPSDTAPSVFAAYVLRESIAPPPAPAQPVIGDFDRDGDTDVIDYAPGPGADRLWRAGGSGVLTRSALSINGTYRPLVGDFDGNGGDDVLWYAPGAPADYLWLGGGANFGVHQISVQGVYAPVIGDFDGDGGDDVLWNAPGGSADWIWTGFGDDQRFSSSRLTMPSSSTPLVGDFDADGVDDVFWYAPGFASDEVWYGGGAFTRAPVRVNGTYQPLVGDFVGDEGDDLFWYRAGPGLDHLWTSSGRVFASSPQQVYGTYRPQVGDHDADGTDEILWQSIPASNPDYLWRLGPTRSSSRLAIDRGDAPLIGQFGAGPGDDLLWWDQPRAFFMDAPFGLLASSLLFLGP